MLYVLWMNRGASILNAAEGSCNTGEEEILFLCRQYCWNLSYLHGTSEMRMALFLSTTY